jgi:hypothetical protein
MIFFAHNPVLIPFDWHCSQEHFAVAHGITEFMQNSIILQTFGERTWHKCQEVENIQIPPYVSPSAMSPYMLPPPQVRKRDIFAFFRGKMEIHPKNYSGHLYSRLAFLHPSFLNSRADRVFLSV